MAKEPLDKDAVREVAKQLLADKIESVEALKDADDAVAAAERQLTEATAQRSRSWAKALAAGWTSAELTGQMGFRAPDARKPGRPRGSRNKTAPRQSTPKPSAASASTPSGGDSTNGSIPGQGQEQNPATAAQ